MADAMGDAKLEICVDNIESAEVAEKSGADRLEICGALELGGITPSYGFVAVIKQMIKIPVHMLIRPRDGNFCYSPKEASQMLKDMEFAHSMGIDGFVVGALSKDNMMVDKKLCRKLIKAAKGKPVTFHRAFDVLRGNKEVALNDIIALGFKRILTSGRALTAMDGLDCIEELVNLAAGRIIIMPGSGVTALNLQDIFFKTNAREFHSSGQFKHYEKEDVLPVVVGSGFHRNADMHVIKHMKQKLIDSVALL